MGCTGLWPLPENRSPRRRKSTTLLRKSLAIILALRKFSMYVEGTTFVIETDYQALAWLSRLNEPSGRLAKWALVLQAYGYIVHYRRGSTNVVADAFSCAPLTVSSSHEGSVPIVSTGIPDALPRTTKSMGTGTSNSPERSLACTHLVCWTPPRAQTFLLLSPSYQIGGTGTSNSPEQEVYTMLSGAIPGVRKYTLRAQA